MKKLLFLILIPFLGIAQTFTANRIKYTVTSSTAPFTVKVARNANFTGAAEIPEIVTYNSKNYIVTAIGESAFVHCNNLTSVTIPNSVTTIGDYVFGACFGLTSVTIPNSVTTIGDYVFGDCFGLTSVTIPNSVITINRGAFAGCSGLTSVTIPNSVTSIGDYVFGVCSGLTSVTIPNSVTTIKEGTFFHCSGLTSVTIPNSVTAIGEDAFAGCRSLKTVNCHITSPLVINANVFGNITQSNCALNVPTGTQVAYQAAAVWRNFSPISGGLLSNHSFAIESALKIYPNPVSEILNIALQEGLQLEK
ncbi:leucine-rich repeat domain-containing protein, partial [Flavobacterium psychrophilum]|uniref:leucine-rich repeat domain-containing protein n=1 Tax=Flavobacterium psychrophilum TaxID=96345 RepID=UPI002CFF1F2E|nr:leucine-rich repeat domain-containing protein [Flavobacterium psychrophilum]